MMVGLLVTAMVAGRVVDSAGNEPLARVDVQLAGTSYRTTTTEDGKFTLPDVPPGKYVLQATTVGYHIVKARFEIAAGERKEFEVVLTPATQRLTERVDVTAEAFEPVRQDSPSQLDLAGVEAKNLASVLADDPLRAVQAMPGVTSNSDFDSQFSLRGASFERIGVYLDGVLLHAPFHVAEGASATGSLTGFNGDSLETIVLHPGAFPPRFSDRSAGVLELETRDGTRQRFMGRATASASNAGMALEGPLGRRASWFASVRKSYLQYLIERTAGSDATLAFGFTDAQGTLAAELSSRHRVRLSVLGGYSDLDRTRFRDRLGMNSLMTSSYRFDMIQASSSYAGDRWIIDNRAAFIRETGVGRNRQELDLARGSYGEWVWHGNATFELARSAPLEFGASLRRMREEGASQRYQFNPFAVRPLDAFRGTGIRPGFYVQQSWSSTRGRASLSAGGRYDWHDVDGKSVWSPHVSGAVQPYEGSRLGFGWGTYGQFPELRQFYSFTGAPWLLPQRAIHYNVSFEQRLGTRSRARVEAYSRQDRDLLFRPLFDPRLINGQVFDPPALAPLRNALRGYARGVQFMLQSRTANGLTGWLSYAYGRAIAGGFPADFDQTHTVNVFASYRLRPSVNVSGRFSYGSGYPIPGYLREEGGRVYLSDRRNQLRVPSYSRVDARINKSFTRDRWKWTLYGEVVNMLDHDNLRFDDLNGYNPQTLQAFPRFDRMFPILPSVGIVAEF